MLFSLFLEKVELAGTSSQRNQCMQATRSPKEIRGKRNTPQGACNSHETSIHCSGADFIEARPHRASMLLKMKNLVTPSPKCAWVDSARDDASVVKGSTASSEASSGGLCQMGSRPCTSQSLHEIKDGWDLLGQENRFRVLRKGAQSRDSFDKARQGDSNFSEVVVRSVPDQVPQHHSGGEPKQPCIRVHTLSGADSYNRPAESLRMNMEPIRRSTWMKQRSEQVRSQRRAFFRQTDNPFSFYAHDPNNAESRFDQLTDGYNCCKIQIENHTFPFPANRTLRCPTNSSDERKLLALKERELLHSSGGYRKAWKTRAASCRLNSEASSMDIAKHPYICGTKRGPPDHKELQFYQNFDASAIPRPVWAGDIFWNVRTGAIDQPKIYRSRLSDNDLAESMLDPSGVTDMQYTA